MKQKTMVMLYVIMVIFGAAGVFASNLHQEDGITPNHSAAYVRTLNRNASTDPDAAFYNPAGLAFMDKTGLYLDFSNQVFYVKKSHTMNFKDLEIRDADGAVTYKARPYSSRPDFYTSMPRGSINSPDVYYAETTAPSWPDFNLVYCGSVDRRRWAAFANVLATQAAPDFAFPRGLASLDWGNLAQAEIAAALMGFGLDSYTVKRAEAVRTEYFIAGTAGGALELIRDVFSAALAFRYIDIRGRQTVKVEGVRIKVRDVDGEADQDMLNSFSQDWDIDTSYRGRGFGVIAGFDLRIGSDFLLAFRYEYYAPMVAEKKTNSFKAPFGVEMSGELDIFKDGKPSPDMEYMSPGGNGTPTFHVTYPQSVSMGLSWMILKGLRLELNGDVYLKSSADWDGRENNYTTAYRAGGCVEVSIMDDVLVSAGYSYFNPGIKPEKRSEIDPGHETHTIGGGMGFTVNDRVTVNLGAFYKMSVPVELTEVTNVNMLDSLGINTYHTIDKKFAETCWSVAFGVTLRLFGESTGGSISPEEGIPAGKSPKITRSTLY